ncbi:MAG: hypothetical protein D6701_14800, partial [Gemmatimonadetes bacterium]
MAEAPGPSGPTADVGAAPRRRWTVGGWRLAALAPGLPQLLAGRWGGGLMALWTWVGLLWLTFARVERLAPAARGGVDQRIALGTLVCGLVAAWTWAVRDARRGPPAPGAPLTQWDLT